VRADGGDRLVGCVEREGDDLALALDATDQAFAAVRKHLGQ